MSADGLELHSPAGQRAAGVTAGRKRRSVVERMRTQRNKADSKEG